MPRRLSEEKARTANQGSYYRNVDLFEPSRSERRTIKKAKRKEKRKKTYKKVKSKIRRFIGW